MVVTAVGVLGLIHGSVLRRALESRVDVHALFGMLLIGFVMARFHARVKLEAPMPPAEIREFSRRLSRTVYLLLYVIIGLRLLTGMVNHVWHGGLPDSNLFESVPQGGPDRGGFDPRDDLQVVVACGLAALVTIRILAYAMWLRVAGPAPQAARAEPAGSRGRVGASLKPSPKSAP